MNRRLQNAVSIIPIVSVCGALFQCARFVDLGWDIDSTAQATSATLKRVAAIETRAAAVSNRRSAVERELEAAQSAKRDEPSLEAEKVVQSANEDMKQLMRQHPSVRRAFEEKAIAEIRGRYSRVLRVLNVPTPIAERAIELLTVAYGTAPDGRGGTFAMSEQQLRANALIELEGLIGRDVVLAVKQVDLVTEGALTAVAGELSYREPLSSSQIAELRDIISVVRASGSQKGETDWALVDRLAGATLTEKQRKILKVFAAQEAYQNASANFRATKQRARPR